MPVSTSQNRASVGAYNNKLLDHFIKNTTQSRGMKPKRSDIPDEIRHIGRYINRAINSHEELN